jgi:hypothetical protein
MELSTTDSSKWKILYKVGAKDDKKHKSIRGKIKLFIAAQDLQILSYSYDIYSDKENFINTE